MTFSCRILIRASGPYGFHDRYSPLTLDSAQQLFLAGLNRCTTLSLTGSLVGFDWKSAPPVTFRSLALPASRRLSERSFPITNFTSMSTALFDEHTVAGEGRLA